VSQVTGAPFTTMVTALLVENEFFIPLDSFFFHSASNGVINLIVLLINFDLLKENKIL
jgi:hypothetical protein